jgi:hypothetical protein
MTPDEFFDGFVLEDYDEWNEEQSSIRKSFHVAVSASHLSDHYCRYHQRKSVAFQRRFGKYWLKDEGVIAFKCALSKRQPLFKPIHHMATAYKHLYTRTSCDVSSSGAIESIKSGSLNIDHDPDDYVVVIRHRNGSTTNMDMWREVLALNDPSDV